MSSRRTGVLRPPAALRCDCSVSHAVCFAASARAAVRRQRTRYVVALRSVTFNARPNCLVRAWTRLSGCSMSCHTAAAL